MTKDELIAALKANDAPGTSQVVFANNAGELRTAQAVFAARPTCPNPAFCNDCRNHKHPLKVGLVAT